MNFMCRHDCDNCCFWNGEDCNLGYEVSYECDSKLVD